MSEQLGPAPVVHPAGAQGMLRSINERAVLELLHREGPLTRAEVATRTGLSKPTVAAALGSLRERGAVADGGQVTGRKGPMATRWAVRADLAWALGVQVGHDIVRLALADAVGTVRATRREAVAADVAGTVAQVARLAAEATAEVGTTPQQLTQVVVGVPASVQPDGRTLFYADGMPDDGVGLGDGIAAALGAPTVLENDVNLAALAEQARGVARGVADFMLISISTGLGVGVVIGGRLHRGAGGAAGEAGYIPVGRDGAHPDAPAGIEPVAPGRPDMVDNHIGGLYLSARARRAGLSGDTSPRGVLERASAGDALALDLVDDTARSIAHVIASTAPVLDPELVVLGGSIGTWREVLLEPVLVHLRAMTTFRPRVEVSDLTGAVVLGAQLLAGELARTSAFAAAASPS